jgi:hypothetical protein
VKSYVITLTSSQELGNPQLLNHYLFVDPVYGLSFVYGLTADGGAIIQTLLLKQLVVVNFFLGDIFFKQHTNLLLLHRLKDHIISHFHLLV